MQPISVETVSGALRSNILVLVKKFLGNNIVALLKIARAIVGCVCESKSSDSASPLELRQRAESDRGK